MRSIAEFGTLPAFGLASVPALRYASADCSGIAHVRVSRRYEKLYTVQFRTSANERLSVQFYAQPPKQRPGLSQLLDRKF
jgi:hypothetical protein